jgi:hypothetical protein
MKQLNDEQVKYIFRSLEPRAEALMEMIRIKPDLNWNTQINELSLIKHILEDLIDEEVPETVTGVLTTPLKEPRDIDETYREMCSHPDFVAGSYYDKESVIDIIFNQICADHDDDNANELFNDAEQIFQNNKRQIFKNIDSCYEYAFQDVDILEDCDLTLEKQNK